MILEYKNKTPFIDFGFNETEKVVASGEVFKVWVSGQYNNLLYNFYLSGSGVADIEEVSDFEYNVSYDEPGEYNIIINLLHKSEKNKTLISNTITVTVV